MRLMKLLKIAKMLRMVRVMKFFRELRLLVIPLIGSVRPLFWTLVMLSLMLYMFAVIFLQATSGAMLDDRALVTAGATPLLADEERKDLYDRWGTVTKSMLSLYMAITGGDDWSNIAAPLKSAGDHYYMLFLFYTAFLMFAVLNVLTGIFVDAAMSAATEDHENVTVEDKQEHQVIDDVEAVCASVGFGKEDMMGLPEVRMLLRTHEMREYMRFFGLTKDMTEHLFTQLSGSGDTEVPLHFFLSVAGKMKGAAKSADMLLILYPLIRLGKRLDGFIDQTVVTLVELEQKFGIIPEQKFDLIPQQMQQRQDSLGGSSDSNRRPAAAEQQLPQSPEEIQIMAAAGRTTTNISGGSMSDGGEVTPASVPMSRPGPGASLAGDKLMQAGMGMPEPEQEGEPTDVLQALKALRAEVVAMADLSARAEVQAAKTKAEEVSRLATLERESIAKEREELMQTVSGAWRAMRADVSTLPSSGGDRAPSDFTTPHLSPRDPVISAAYQDPVLSPEFVDFNLQEPAARLQPPSGARTQPMREDEPTPGVGVQRTCAPAEQVMPFCIGRRGS
eukprot:gnl/TRDRNA2_/TRDRNA2_165896_c2_seq2.p1 gnl/TRDRNA2_/TRDRNA2_165896_c2~~gnl/TRDRNA2_/TRDRNA2_165896_c2_seq2.p1  ORF type:complete len:654 (+),score=125.26 gnl/TRDRNA2_/TRDRNA2_165896_c2_seq2:285-1964(+)